MRQRVGSKTGEEASHVQWRLEVCTCSETKRFHRDIVALHGSTDKRIERLRVGEGAFFQK